MLHVCATSNKIDLSQESLQCYRKIELNQIQVPKINENYLHGNHDL